MSPARQPTDTLGRLVIELENLDELTLDRPTLRALADHFEGQRRALDAGRDRPVISARVSTMRTAEAFEWLLGRPHLTRPDPVPEVPTVDDVRAHPAYWISGPGRLVAERTRCPHDYHLTDSCPCC
jgi:hypothetical protein